MISSPTSTHLRLELPGGLALVATADPGHELLGEFFTLYDRAFVLPSEKEEFSGFVDCLALNLGDAHDQLVARWGAFREWVLLVRDANAGNEVVGGSNFICFPLPAPAEPPMLSMHLNYLFVVPEHRGRGYLTRLLHACEALARRTFQGLPSRDEMPLLLFLEQNDPLRLDPEEYARDSEHAGIDQVDRVRIWQRAGARIIDFPYVQPSLSPQQEPDDGLMLSVIGARGNALHGCTLRRHLERFFGISVLKGRDPLGEPVSRQQIDQCEQACRAGASFSLFDPAPWIASLGAGPPYDLHREEVVGTAAQRLIDVLGARTGQPAA